MEEKNICKKCGCVYQACDQSYVGKTIIQEAGFISINEKLSMVRGLIAARQYDTALKRLQELEDERGGMDEFQFLKAKVLSHDFTISDDTRVKDCLDSADVMATRNGNDDLQAEIMQARQRLARAEQALPVRNALKTEEALLHDALEMEQEAKSSLELLQAEHSRIDDEISAKRRSLREIARGLTANRCLRLIPFVLGVLLLVIAVSAALRCFPELPKAIRQSAPALYTAVNQFASQHADIPFLVSSPISLGSLLGRIPFISELTHSVDDDLILLIASALLALIFLWKALRNKWAKSKKSDVKSEKSDIAPLMEKSKKIARDLSEKKRELEMRTKARSEIEEKVNSLRVQMNQLMGD